MKVLNLVYNRIGNSLSILIDYPDVQLQLFDEVYFNIDGLNAEITAVSVEENSLKVRLNLKNREVELTFKENSVVIPYLGSLTVDDEGYICPVDIPELSFKIGMSPELSQYWKDGKLFIPQENFFKTVVKILAKII
ncbi:hypothetical protein [Persephonella sp.]